MTELGFNFRHLGSKVHVLSRQTISIEHLDISRQINKPEKTVAPHPFSLCLNHLIILLNALDVCYRKYKENILF